ncbi:unnamed protein product [Diabrotica balteata]|uniref:Uncharacterized protein n=1 Tax=Diabrotica balteata TaxID=107213 RepID=A0A9N9T8A5_DIABA|nr:unnamed protein product [Diabrotica balteata]
MSMKSISAKNNVFICDEKDIFVSENCILGILPTPIILSIGEWIHYEFTLSVDVLEKMNKRIRFNSDDDLALLRQVVSQNVLQQPEQWEALRENMIILTKKEFSVRTLRDHLKHLMEIWKKKDAVNRVRSGVEEIFSERDNLLQEIWDITRTTNLTPSKLKRKTKQEQQSSEIGVALRDLAAKYYAKEELDMSIDHEENVISDHDYNCVASTSQETPQVGYGQTPDEETVNEGPIKRLKDETAEEGPSSRKQIAGPIRKRKNQSAGLRRSGLTFIQERSEREHNIRVRELQLEEDKLQLEKRRLKFRSGR